MRPDQSRGVDFTKEYSSKSVNNVTRMLTAGFNGIAREEDLYPTFESETEVRISGGVAVKDDTVVHLGCETTGDNWNDFTVGDVILDLEDPNNYLQSSDDPSEEVFDMPGHWPTDSTSSRAYIVLSYTYLDPKDSFNSPTGEKKFDADGYVRPQLSEQEDLEKGIYEDGQSPRYTPIDSNSFSGQAENKSFLPGKNVSEDHNGAIEVLHIDPDEVVPSWKSYHVPEPGSVSSIKILKNPLDFDPDKHLFLGMVFFKEAKKIINPVMTFDYLRGNDILNNSEYITRNVFNYVQEYTDAQARSADSQNFITNHPDEPTNLNKLVATGTITDSPSGKIVFKDISGMGSYILEETATWTGSDITVTHNFGQYLQVKVLEEVSKEELQADIVQTLNSFTVSLDENETSPLSIIIRY